jgi:hypothetical protein
MSSAVLERPVEQFEVKQPVNPPNQADFVTVTPDPAVPKDLSDPHPLLPVFVAGAIAFMLAVGFVGSILAGIALRYSGVMAR